MPRCELCRLRYDAESPADRSRHRRVHDALLNGLRYSPTRSDRVISEQDGARFVVVTRDSPIAQRRRAVSVFRVASREMRYSGSGYTKREPKEDDSHAFLLYRGNRLTGLFILARRRGWVEGAWNEQEPNGVAEVSGWDVRERDQGAVSLWSVDFMWIARKYRRQGVGSLLLRCAAGFLGATSEEIAWLPPFTPLGKAFIRHVQPKAFRAAR
jgi:GNAT superfamily N-acetyltransferase